MNDVGAPLPLASGKRIDDLATLAKNPLLAPLSLRELGTLIDVLDQVAIPAGSVVALSGEGGEYVYFVLEGEAHARRGQVETRPLRPADHFGELALLPFVNSLNASGEYASPTAQYVRITARI